MATYSTLNRLPMDADVQPAGSALDGDIRRRWDSDPDLRAEFDGNFGAWAAYCEAEAKGLIKRLGRRR